jgi:hypothetical protein
MFKLFIILLYRKLLIIYLILLDSMLIYSTVLNIVSFM